MERKYGLTIDGREAQALEGGQSGCASAEMVMAEGQAKSLEPTPSDAAPGTSAALRRWDTNGNGRITCKEAREPGIAPMHRRHSAYWFMRDRYGYGVVCE